MVDWLEIQDQSRSCVVCIGIGSLVPPGQRRAFATRIRVRHSASVASEVDGKRCAPLCNRAPSTSRAQGLSCLSPSCRNLTALTCLRRRGSARKRLLPGGTACLCTRPRLSSPTSEERVSSRRPRLSLCPCELIRAREVTGTRLRGSHACKGARYLHNGLSTPCSPSRDVQ